MAEELQAHNWDIVDFHGATLLVDVNRSTKLEIRYNGSVDHYKAIFVAKAKPKTMVLILKKHLLMLLDLLLLELLLSLQPFFDRNCLRWMFKKCIP